MPCAVEEVPVSQSFHIKKTNGYNKSIIKQIQSKTKKQDSDIKTLELCNNLENNPANLVLVSDYVKEKGNDKIHLPESKVTSDMYIRICGLDGTIYRGEKYMFDDWEQLYLEKPTKMEVLGILESPRGMVPLPQWVVLVAEDGHVYGYGDEYLQLFATSLKEMIENGILDTGISYDYPHDLSDEEEEVLEQDEEIQRRRQKTKEFIDKDADEFNDFLNSF